MIARAAVLVAALLALGWTEGSAAETERRIDAEDCLEQAAALVKPTTVVTVELARGGAVQGFSLTAQADSLFLQSGSRPDVAFQHLRFSRAEVQGIRFQRPPAFRRRWGIIGFVAGGLVTAALVNSDTDAGFTGPAIAGVFGGLIGAGILQTVIPRPEEEEIYIRCQGQSP